MGIKIEKVSFEGWNNCLKISNGLLEVIVPTEVGIRILGFNVIGKENMIYLNPEEKGLTGGEKYRFYGGHRIWHTPESFERTYSPDNFPIKVKEIENGLILIQDIEPETFMQKELEIIMDPGTAKITVKNRIYNKGLWPVETSVWSVTQFEKKGIHVMPVQKDEFQLPPTWNMSFWSYTNLNDPRLTLNKDYMYLRQDPDYTETPVKIGFRTRAAWAAFSVKGQLIVKKYEFHEDKIYPDNNCAYETYTNEDFIEMETLSPLTNIQPGDFAEQTEYWYLFDNIEVKIDDDYVKQTIQPIVDKL